MHSEPPAYNVLRARNKHSPRTNVCVDTNKHTAAHSADVWGGRDDLMCDCGADGGWGGGSGVSGFKGGALPFKLRLKASEAVTLDW